MMRAESSLCGDAALPLLPPKKTFDCGKTFSTSSNLTQHVLIHTDERPHVCDLCGRAFRQSGNLSKHRKSHENAHLRWNRATSSKPFKCQEAGCEKSFTANNSLQNHMRKHTGEQPYACPYDDCSERFTLKTGLQTHLKLHEALNGERAICLHAACRKSFKTNAELRTHMYISCPGLVEECAALRSALAHTIREFDSAEMPNKQESMLGAAVQRSKVLLTLLPEEYLIRREEVMESCRMNLDGCCGEGSKTCNNFLLSTDDMRNRIDSAWRLHQDAAAEVATTSAKPSSDAGFSHNGGGDNSGIYTLIEAAAGAIREAEQRPCLPGEACIDGCGPQQKKRLFEDLYTDRFFRADSFPTGDQPSERL